MKYGPCFFGYFGRYKLFIHMSVINENDHTDKIFLLCSEFAHVQFCSKRPDPNWSIKRRKKSIISLLLDVERKRIIFESFFLVDMATI